MRHEYEWQVDNVKLCQLGASDIENLRRWRNNPDNCKFLRKIPYISEEQQKIWYEKYLEDETEICFAIYETNELCKMVGSLSLLNFDSDKVELGRVMIGEKSAHGKGIGTKAIIAAFSICFFRLGMKQVYLHVYENNISAYKTYEKAGMTIVKAMDTEFGRELLMSIGRDEFKEKGRKYYA